MTSIHAWTAAFKAEVGPGAGLGTVPILLCMGLFSRF